MDKNSTKYTVIFALAVCVVCSFLLALVSEGLRPQREINEDMDVKKNILSAAQIKGVSIKKISVKALEDLYNSKIRESVIDDQGNVVLGKNPLNIEDDQQLYPLYIYRDEGKTVAYIFPVSGKGLWSTIYGFLALEKDAVTIRGITFYKHGETPGLGGEVETSWFQDNFKGKKIYDAKKNMVRPVKVIKGKVEDKLSGTDVHYAVDGISGATMTSKGVSSFLDKWIRIYEPYLSKRR